MSEVSSSCTGVCSCVRKIRLDRRSKIGIVFITLRVNPRKRAVGRGRAAGLPAGAACARAWRRAGRRPAARWPRPGGAAAGPARVPPASPPAAARGPRPRRAHAERATPCNHTHMRN